MRVTVFSEIGNKRKLGEIKVNTLCPSDSMQKVFDTVVVCTGGTSKGHLPKLLNCTTQSNGDLLSVYKNRVYGTRKR